MMVAGMEQTGRGGGGKAISTMPGTIQGNTTQYIWRSRANAPGFMERERERSCGSWLMVELTLEDAPLGNNRVFAVFLIPNFGIVFYCTPYLSGWFVWMRSFVCMPSQILDTGSLPLFARGQPGPASSVNPAQVSRVPCVRTTVVRITRRGCPELLSGQPHQCKDAFVCFCLSPGSIQYEYC